MKEKQRDDWNSNMAKLCLFKITKKQAEKQIKKTRSQRDNQDKKETSYRDK